MRHRKQYRKLGLKTNQRKALLKGLAISLIEHGAITTTKARAKELKRYIEKIISKVRKEDQTHARRLVFQKLQNKEVVKKLFDEYREEFVGRPGGYTRIHLLGNRAGDAAEMAKISLILDGLSEKEEVVEEKPAKKAEKKAPAEKKVEKKKAAPKKKAAKAEEKVEEKTEDKKEEKKAAKKPAKKATKAKKEEKAEKAVEETVSEEKKDDK